MRRALKTGVLAIALLAIAAAAASSRPQTSTYSGTSSRGGRVHFRTDARKAHDFKIRGRPLFKSARIKRHLTASGKAVWRFHVHNRHWRVHGHWVGRTTVHGSICNLAASPDGCPNGEHLQTYVAEAKSRR
jgi:hypothetical protein